MLKQEKTISKISKVCNQASLAAGKVLSRYFQKQFKVYEKKGAGLVTDADFEAEETILKILTREFPNFGFVCEESGIQHPKGRGEGTFYVDPLDGTTNFVHGFPFFCVSIGVSLHGKLVAGAIYHPPLNDLYWCKLGHGAYLGKKRIHVSKTLTLTDSLLTTGFSVQKSAKKELSPFSKLVATSRGVRRPGSAALDLAYTARGVFDGFWEKNLSPWDVAAGTLLVREAGGRVTNFQKQEFDPSMKQVLASNSRLHDPLAKVIRAGQKN